MAKNYKIINAHNFIVECKKCGQVFSPHANAKRVSCPNKRNH